MTINYIENMNEYVTSSGERIKISTAYEEEMEQYGEQIKWLPESPARLTDET